MKRKSIIGLVSALLVCGTLTAVPGVQAGTADGGFHMKAGYSGFSGIYPPLKPGAGSPTDPNPETPEQPGSGTGSEESDGSGGEGTAPGTETPSVPEPTIPPVESDPMRFTVARIGTGNCGVTLRGSYTEDVRLVSPSGKTTVVDPKYTTGQKVNVFSEAGQWKIEGPLIAVSMEGMDCLISLDDWGTLRQGDMTKFFNLAVNLKSVVTPPRGIVNASYMFKNTLAFRGDLSDWDTSTVTNMTSILEGARVFDGDISSWDTSNVKRMGYALNNTPKLNSDLSSWNVCKVEYSNQWVGGSGIYWKPELHPRFDDRSLCG